MAGTLRRELVATRVRFRNIFFDAVAIAAALAVATLRPSPSWIEAHYANGTYPAIDRGVRALTGPLPFCLGDVLFVVAVVWLVAYWIRAVRRTRTTGAYALARASLRTVAVACAVFVWFAFSWAYNYSRVPLAEKIVVHDERTDETTVAAFADRLVDELSRDAPAAHRERLDDALMKARLLPSFDAAIHRLGDLATFAPPRVKPTIFQPFFELSATSGFTDPWTHEINVDAGAFPFERPMYYAHEWAHIAGFTDESEANFISVLACTNARDPTLRYSGWLLVWFNLPQNVHLTHHMSRIAYADIAAVRARYLAHVSPPVAHASSIAYDRYLKSNGVKAGYASYRLFIRWMTGADFDRSGLPIVRQAPSGRSG